MLFIWDSIIEKHYPDIKYVYKTEIASLGEYINTDTTSRFFTDKYHALVFIKDEKISNEGYFGSVDEMCDAFNQWFEDFDVPVFKTIEDIENFAAEVKDAGTGIIEYHEFKTEDIAHDSLELKKSETDCKTDKE